MGGMTHESQEKATFAAGCFWGVETSFLAQTGVTNAVSGYTGGHVEHPTYESVCGGETGHAEAVEVTFDPSKTTYEKLVKKFFEMHDPTQMNRQGPDVGEQYRSVIFYHSFEQKEIAERVAKELAPQYFPKTIATSLEPAQTFWKAEDYHQRYAEKHPGRVVCHI
ncbi:peptide-methionine (S)-S-oxide reductase [Candidatus Kaiserbacteria bacterium RIFCSPLOWO2_01_FULL_52_12b]|uniref:Peptide methionine sulfoxide reductase MsrA n=1 Tax=Candidatus Kaiserbacteria bacterium RIFCSPLOWO2_01_FULL_52_12b TaxID=1798509 RepID=A0A1F6EXM5_9BACT|nr:MAG: peptide-methionine (S)-S-oxide reductase [Candidatus Kaiserbacteria bacterium RIFCSPLOWO2_01_FULL_52_12b]